MSEYERYFQVAFVAVYLLFIWFWGDPAKNRFSQGLRDRLNPFLDALGLTHGWLMYATAPWVFANYFAIEYRKGGQLVREMRAIEYQQKKWFVRVGEEPRLVTPTLRFYEKLGREEGLDIDEVRLVRWQKKRPPMPASFFGRFDHDAFVAAPFVPRVVGECRDGKVANYFLADANARAAAKAATKAPTAAAAAAAAAAKAAIEPPKDANGEPKKKPIGPSLVVTVPVNMREGPTGKATKIRMLPVGARVRRLGPEESVFYQIEHRGTTGWAYLYNFADAPTEKKKAEQAQKAPPSAAPSPAQARVEKPT